MKKSCSSIFSWRLSQVLLLCLLFFALQMIVFAIVYHLFLQLFIYHRSLHTEDRMYGACSLSSLVHGVDGWVEGKSPRAQLSLTHHHIQHSLGNQPSGQWPKQVEIAPQTTHDTPRRVEKSDYNKTELSTS